MARRGVPREVNWYLREWMEARGLAGRGAQARMMERTGWSRATMSQLYNGTQDYNPALVRAAAKALGIREYELFLPPEEANHIRRLRQAAEDEHRLRLVAEERSAYKAAERDHPAPRKSNG